jgi:putative nucleotidyltransferase with HDIG domain
LQISAVRDLPALPAAALELLELLDHDDVEIGRLIAKISLDQALTAKTLRLANSSFYGMSRRISSVADATAVLGLRTVRMVVTVTALTSAFERPLCTGFDFAGFWAHAVSTAVAAKLIADASGADGTTAFTAGLLHDIGQLALASGFPERYEKVQAYRSASGLELCDAELTLLGTDHAAVGKLVAERWCFPSEIVDAIALHHALLNPVDVSPLVDVVHAANVLAHQIARSPGDVISAATRDRWVGLGLCAETWASVLAETRTQTSAILIAVMN